MLIEFDWSYHEKNVVMVCPCGVAGDRAHP